MKDKEEEEDGKKREEIQKGKQERMNMKAWECKRVRLKG